MFLRSLLVSPRLLCGVHLLTCIQNPRDRNSGELFHQHRRKCGENLTNIFSDFRFLLAARKFIRKSPRIPQCVNHKSLTTETLGVKVTTNFSASEPLPFPGRFPYSNPTICWDYSSGRVMGSLFLVEVVEEGGRSSTRDSKQTSKESCATIDDPCSMYLGGCRFTTKLGVECPKPLVLQCFWRACLTLGGESSPLREGGMGRQDT